ncbi:MAG: Gfo/Idh/MocA family oxidoreductase [Bryobacterales bacterium]|nr:Gfo/Idh/MocA family oxidoreductase [Bryobacteraceae bacterium]MDW8129007.1 Gfo/Idh/MocA family oxidoreductase [Bryobacterales bacterium]
MPGSSGSLSRRRFVAASLAMPLAAQPRVRVALAGTGHRGTSSWGRELLEELGHRVQMVGLFDTNRKRLEAARRLIGTEAPLYTDFDRMVRETHPDYVIVTTPDSTHHEYIIRAMELGRDVITEKPMTTDEVKCQAILDAEKKTGRRVIVTFNYRYSNTAQKIKELLMAGTIGPVTSIDFHWYLDVYHGADYFRRWHAYRAKSGTLFVHKATHHFDLINWYLEADPVEVTAFAALRKYGRNGSFRGTNCRACPHKDKCEFYWDMTRNKRLMELYAECESEDGYYRDACVFREDIDIFDTMVAQVRYSNGALMSYSLNAFMPYEGYHLAFNGMNGRIEVRVYERQPWEVPRQDEIRVTKNFGKSEVLVIPHAKGGHFGADPRLRAMIFDPAKPDPLKQRAGSRAGAMSLLTGVAAVKSADSGGQPVKIASLVRL